MRFWDGVMFTLLLAAVIVSVAIAHWLYGWEAVWLTLTAFFAGMGMTGRLSSKKGTRL